MKKILLLFFVCINLLSCKQQAGCATPTNEIVEYIIEKPLVESISDIEGGGECWQGYSLFLKFNTAPSFIDKLLNLGYEETTWNDIEYGLTSPIDLKLDFKEGWNPENVKNKRCFSKRDSNEWTGGGDHYYLVDTDQNIAYFYGVGM
ncbi:hypothetical protein UMM65_14490 [Aureibaculum sp. 2210JD6-5]|uniref:hypothetical protein n=1 Tax=Aureibaculum sp. 2210JD6-5 TaxID=3103957 RepID=UPI002AACBF0C|nr:hypothetical protein [Aureibaculum sp. 2210JD6-5]MDY7396456.1 hypothetical protein [Aureibaculum sp. 2210JD6-5]